MIDVTFVDSYQGNGTGSGSAHYICQLCNEYIEDYEDLWFSQYCDVGTIVESDCENCMTTNRLKKIEYDRYENTNK